MATTNVRLLPISVEASEIAAATATSGVTDGAGAEQIPAAPVLLVLQTRAEPHGQLMTLLPQPVGRLVPQEFAPKSVQVLQGSCSNKQHGAE